MTCKDCIHYEACCNWTEEEHGAMEMTTAEEGCNYFKDKSKFIELPCNVGDSVYEPFVCCDYPANPMEKCYIEGSCRKCEYCTSKIIERKFSMADYDAIKNKIWFLTREEAEKALEERKKE